jgi:xanthine dehydrogenase accessory factor
MFVGRGVVEGTIGGGRLEWESTAAARALLDDPAASGRLSRIVLAADVGQCCGGVVWVWVERFGREDVGLLQQAREAGARGAAVLSSTVRGAGVERRVVSASVGAGVLGAGAVSGASAGIGGHVDALLRLPRARAWPSVVRDAAGEVTLLERLDDELPAVWLYGAGHVGQALARLLTELPLRLTWVDSRTELFPAGLALEARVRGDLDPVATVGDAPADAYFLVMTHSHALDYDLVRAILRRNDFAWLGLIGSQSKAARFRSRLCRDGIAAERISRLVCPIGVPGIESKWPAAIAVGVAAQLMQEFSVAAQLCYDERRPGTDALSSSPELRALRASDKRVPKGSGPRLPDVREEGAPYELLRALVPDVSQSPDHLTGCGQESCSTCGTGRDRARPASDGGRRAGDDAAGGAGSAGDDQNAAPGVQRDAAAGMSA